MSDTQEIKDKIDIVDFIGEYVELKPAGINHKACCPFHQEKTPSFMVNRERQSFHCFGCGKGGDIFSFLQEIEGMEFVEALKHLADRAGIQLTNEPSQINTSQKNRIKKINEESARFFHKFLLQMDSSKDARSYLQERGLAPETIEEWQIGFIPNQWDLLTKYLLKKGYSIDDLVASGLTIKKDGAPSASSPRSDPAKPGQASQSLKGFYDRFRGRIMFPIWDIHGSVVGFTGRQLVPDDRSGKYINTPQTIVFDKSRVVFGLDKAKQEIRKKDLIVMVEGQTDVISSHQAGMKNVVASSGTALTEGQIKLLNRYSKNMSMAFDADAAGEAAAKRGIDLAVQAGMNVKVIQIPEGKDPDEYIKNDSKNWAQVVENAQSVMEWHFDRVREKYSDVSDPKQKQAVANELLNEIQLIPYAVERDHWLKELGLLLGVDVGVLREDMTRFRRKGEVKKTREETRDNLPATQKKNRLDLLIDRFFALLLKMPDFKFELPNISVSILSTELYFSLYKAINEEYTRSSKIEIDELRKLFDNERQENLVDVLLMKGEHYFGHMKEKDIIREIEKTLDQIKIEIIKKRRQELQIEIAQAEKKGDDNQLKKLLIEFNQLQRSKIKD